MFLIRLLLGKYSKTTNLSKAGANIKKLLGYVKVEWRRMALGMVLGIASAAFNALMLIAFQVIFSIVLKGDTPARDLPMRLPFVGPVKLADWLPAEMSDGNVALGSVLLACACIPLMIFIRGFLSFLSSRTYTKVASHVLYRIRNDLYSSVLRQSLTYFNHSKAGELIQIVWYQASTLQVNALALVQALTKHPMTIISILVVLFGMDPFFTLMSLFVFPLCLLPVRMISKRVRHSGKLEVEAATKMLVSMQEAYGGIRLVKGSSMENYELERFEKGNRASTIDSVKFNSMADLNTALVETVASFGVAAGLVYWWHEERGAAEFFMLVMALTQMYPPIKELSRVGINTQKTLAACEEVFELLERKPTVADKPDAVELTQVKGAITLRNVGYSYTGSDGRKLDKMALRDVSCEFEPGKFYALIGPSGSGKSTIFSLLMRYYDVDQGAVTIDGKDIRDVTQGSLRENIGIVSQDVFLFHDTIWENIRYGRLDASREEILAAAQKAHVDAFVQEFQEGYETIVGDGGSKISGGQKQRISIARTILKNAPVLLLDEATSALDTESERFIQESLHDLAEGRTVIAIAHRLSTVLAAHKIIVMKDGQIDSVGSHQELMASSELYRRLYGLQFNSDHSPAASPELAVAANAPLAV